MLPPEDTRNTAYAWNTRPAASARAPVVSGWHAKMDELLRRDYAFLDCRFEADGILFRGLHGGLDACLEAQIWLPSCDSGPLGALERELGVYLLSHELSDALSVSRLWEGNGDSGILVFSAAEFHRRWQCRQAAVLGFAEPGIVFRYPFLVDPLPIPAHSACVVMDGAPLPAVPPSLPLVRTPRSLAGNRAGLQRHVMAALTALRFVPAAFVDTTEKPRRIEGNPGPSAR